MGRGFWNKLDKLLPMRYTLKVVNLNAYMTIPVTSYMAQKRTQFVEIEPKMYWL